MKAYTLMMPLDAGHRARVTHEMRGWLLDCGAGVEVVADASDERVWREVARIYDGGVAQFIADAEPLAVTS